MLHGLALTAVVFAAQVGGPRGNDRNLNKFATIGDSLTAGTCSGCPALTPWPSVLLATLSQSWELTNTAVAGSTVAQMDSVQWTPQVQGKRFSVVVIYGGINDLAAGTSASSIFATLTGMTDEVNAEGATAVLVTPMPWKNFSGWNSGRQTQTESLRALILAWCTTPRKVCVDLYPLAGESGDAQALKAAYDMGDGLHLNQTGQNFIAATVAATSTGL